MNSSRQRRTSAAYYRSVAQGNTAYICIRVGGIVSETNFKFFVQFNTWTAIFCTFIVTVIGVCIGELRATVRLPWNVVRERNVSTATPSISAPIAPSHRTV